MMNRIVFIGLLWIVPHQIWGQSTMAFQQKPPELFRQWERNSMNQLLGFGVSSMAAGMILIQESKGQHYDQGIQHLAWGAINTTISSIALRGVSRRNYAALNIQERAGQVKRILGINALLDVLYVGAGTALILSNEDKLMGHGRGILIQGGFLLLFDAFHYLRVKKMQKEHLTF